MTKKTALDVFNPLKKEIADFVAPSLKLAVTDFETSESAISAAKTVRELLKKVTDRRRELVDPLNAKVKEINAYAKDIEMPLKQAESHIMGQLNSFAAKQEEIRQAELRRVEEENRRKQEELLRAQEEERQKIEAAASAFGEDPEEVAAEVEVKQVAEQAAINNEYYQAEWAARKETQISNTRRIAKVKVVDLDQVPKEFLIRTVNEKAALAAMKAGVKIPGLEMDYKVSVAIAANTRSPLLRRGSQW